MPLNINNDVAAEKEKNAQVRLLHELEKKAYYKTRMQLNRLANLAADQYAQDQSVDLTRLILGQIYGFDQLFRSHYAITVSAFSKRNFNFLKSHSHVLETKDLGGAVDAFQALALEWIRENALNQAQLIARTTQKDVTDVISDGQKEGLGAREIARTIKDRVGGVVAASRALTIAVTETHNAATWASLESVNQINEELDTKFKKKWLPVEDSRTRPAHAAMDWKAAIALDEKFNVGGEAMDRPGDPSASAAQVVNCRCVLIYED